MVDECGALIFGAGSGGASAPLFYFGKRETRAVCQKGETGEKSEKGKPAQRRNSLSRLSRRERSEPHVFP